MAFSIDELVNRQVLKWQEERRLAERAGAAEPVHPQRPMICISRDYGGRGAEIGRVAAERLDFHYYAQELVHQIAEEAHVRRQLIESLDERIQDAIDNWIGEQIGGQFFAHSDYLRNLSKVVLTLGRHGKGVIVGRGAQFILDPAWTLRVRAFAPLEARVARIAERERLGPDQARARVLKIDAERAAFCRQHFDREIADPNHYDLLLNTATVPIDGCADLVVRAFRARFGGAA